MNINDIIAYISTSASREDLNLIARAHRFRNDSLSRSAKFAFRKGDKVSWNSSRSGQTMTGTIEKLNQKTCSVMTNAGMWRVSATLLRKL